MFLKPVTYHDPVTGKVLSGTAYHMEVLTDYDQGRAFETGYYPTVTIKYSDAALNEALRDDNGVPYEGVTEEMLTVRRWNPNVSNDPNDLKQPGAASVTGMAPGSARSTSTLHRTRSASKLIT